MRTTPSLATALVVTVSLVATGSLMATGRWGPLVAPAAASPGGACGDVPVSPFVDVARHSAHAAAVDCLFWYGVARGATIDRYGPGRAVRRDQMASFVARTLTAAGHEPPPAGEPRFDDLEGNPHRADVERLATAGIVQGRGDRRYAPADAVPRGQMTAFVIRAHEYVTGDRATATRDHFPDDDGHTHEATIDAAAELGLAHGHRDGTFRPQQPTRRAPMASFTTRLLDRFVASDHMRPRPVGYDARASALPASLRAEMTGVSWHEGCPVPLDDLRLVRLVHHDLAGSRRWGLLVLHHGAVGVVARAFGEVHDAGFRIGRMRPVSRFSGDDSRSMAANNTSAFNCRRVSGTAVWSEHAYGRAIDVNPVQNPYVRGDRVEPEAGRAYLDRDDVRPGMITRPGPVTDAFDARGWGWGGDWRSAKDYQHFSATGR